MVLYKFNYYYFSKPSVGMIPREFKNYNKITTKLLLLLYTGCMRSIGLIMALTGLYNNAGMLR